MSHPVISDLLIKIAPCWHTSIPDGPSFCLESNKKINNSHLSGYTLRFHSHLQLPSSTSLPITAVPGAGSLSKMVSPNWSQPIILSVTNPCHTPFSRATRPNPWARSGTRLFGEPVLIAFVWGSMLFPFSTYEFVSSRPLIKYV